MRTSQHYLYYTLALYQFEIVSFKTTPVAVLS